MAPFFRRDTVKTYKSILFIIIGLLVLIVALQLYYISQLNSSKNEIALKSTQQPTNIMKSFDRFGGSNPFEDMIKMQKEMDKLFNSMSSNFATMPGFENFFNDLSVSPALNLKDMGNRYELSLNIPGSDASSIKIDTKGRELKIEAKTKKDKSKKGEEYIYKEIFSGSFSRTLTLPEDADTSKLKSSYKDGILKIVIPKF